MASRRRFNAREYRVLGRFLCCAEKAFGGCRDGGGKGRIVVFGGILVSRGNLDCESNGMKEIFFYQDYH